MVSIIIPAYNVEPFVGKCLDSVLSQSYQNFEVIVVNDGSTDGTLKVLNKYAAHDERVRVITQENGGVSAARNTALKAARGEYITYVDADDSVPKNHLEDLVKLMKDDVDFVVGSNDEIKIKRVHHILTPLVIENNEVEEKFVEFDSVIWWPWGKLFRASIIRDNHLTYDLSVPFGEDHIFNLLYAKHMTGKVIVIDKIVYNYHQIRGGLTGRFCPKYADYQIYIDCKIFDFFGGIEKTPEKLVNYFTGYHFWGSVEYYIAWCSNKTAAKMIRHTVEIYSNRLNDKILYEFFTPGEAELLKNDNIESFVPLYKKNHPRSTVWRKIRRAGRNALVFGQNIVINARRRIELFSF